MDPPEDHLLQTTLDDIPALLRWVELSALSGFMSEKAAADWRARIEVWRQRLKRTARD